MKCKIHFSFFIDAKSISGKRKMQKELTQPLVDQYGESSVNSNDVFKFTIQYEDFTWEYAFFNLIEFAQILGKQWIISGSINDYCSLWSNHSKIVGIDSIGIEVDHLLHFSQVCAIKTKINLY
ncbi:hypothetical protein HB790_12865 [Listeria welshimeri]|nr:hypothetical protein [Listeria welshimeri]MBC1414299.1 hypothetical protein [Listeria welshimeri]MBC1448295.1 hypothetical protein [Listeria welshimeri]MBC1453033.1 hypothetical protein [Listeria welshimeri]MBC1462207.1 hypothetical protein [Listeria welshimeri]